MPAVIDTADAISNEIIAQVAADRWPLITELVADGKVEDPISQVGVYPVNTLTRFSKARFYVQTPSRLIHDGETFDTCSDQWMNMIYIVFGYQMEGPKDDDDYPGGRERVNEFIRFAEQFGDWFLLNMTRLDLPGDVVTRLQKDQTEQELVNSQLLKNDHFFMTMITAVYG